MPHRIVFDRQSCAGFFSCTKVDPQDFDRGEDKSSLTGGTELREDLFEKEVEPGNLENAIEAAQVCPVDAIKVVDEEGNVVAGPEKLPVER